MIRTTFNLRFFMILFAIFLCLSDLFSSETIKDMYCITNNVPMYSSYPAQDTVKILVEPPFITNSIQLPFMNQLMKFDRVKMLEEKGDWARVELETGHKDAQNSQKETGWVVRSSLDEWVVSKFFKTKDNVFQAKHEINIYGNSLNTVELKDEIVVDKIYTKDTYRILKGNGDRFYLVMSNGKDGWIQSSDIDTSKLVAKDFSYLIKEYFTNLPSKYLRNQFQEPLKYEIDRYDVPDKYLLSGNLANVVQFAEYTLPNNLNTCLMMRKGDKEINLTEYFEKKHGMKEWIVDGKKYSIRKQIIKNFFGFIAVIEIGIPEDYTRLLREFMRLHSNDQDIVGGYFKWSAFERYVEFIKSKGKFEEVAHITLYNRDTDLSEIQTIEIMGPYAIELSLKYLKEDVNKIYLDGNDFILQLGIAGNGVNLDDLPDLYNEIDESRYGIRPDNNNDLFYSKFKYKLKPEIMKFKISNISKSLVTKWDIIRTLDMKLVKPGIEIDEKIVNPFLRKIIVYNKVYHLYKDILISDIKYLPELNIYFIGLDLLDKRESWILVINDKGKYLYFGHANVLVPNLDGYINNIFIVLGLNGINKIGGIQSEY